MPPLPKNRDPYDEIYLSPEWYGLVPDSNLGLLDPASAGGETIGSGKNDPRQNFNFSIESVKRFHQSIEGKYNKPTFAHYGAQGQRDTKFGHGGLVGTGLMANRNLFSWGEVAWERTGAGALNSEGVRVTSDDGNGSLRTTKGLKLTISARDCPGDGTVPIYSGAAPEKTGIAMIFAHGQGHRGAHNKHFGYDHQGSYGDEHQRSLFATMFAIIKMSKEAQWHRRESV
jgi:hypothetical protein